MSGDEAAFAAASTAAEAVRSLNHITIGRALAPSGAYDVLGQLVVMAGRLPQALDQLESGVRGQYEAVRLRHDRGGPVGESVAALELALVDARSDAEALRDGLSRAQSAIAYVALAEEGEG